MKNSPLPTSVFTLATTPAGSLSLALCIAFASQGAWSATCPARPACNVQQNGFNGNLAAGQSLCISGTFSGNINNLPAGATIYVPAGANFNPASVGNPAGSIINCGSASLPSLTLNTGFSFSNHGTAEFRNNINWNGKANFFNDAGARMSFRTTFAMKGASTITNDGEILGSGDFASEPNTNITNTGYIRISGGNFNPDGVVINSGFVQTDEFININPSSELINNCSFISQKGFNNNSAKTRNNGYIFVTGTGNNNDLVQNNQPFSQGPNAVVVGTRFFNSAAITGGGKFYFTGDTRNQGPIGQDGGGINFYDTTRTTNRIFDAQNVVPHPSVISSAFTPPAVDAVVPSCSKNVAPTKPIITINIIAGDDIINASEDDAAVNVGGGTTDAPNGAKVSLEINGKSYSATVNNNSWAVLVPAADVQIFDATEQAIAQVTLADNATSSEKVTRAVAHVTELPRITIGVVAGDDIINSVEDDAPVTIQGTTTLAENGSQVEVLINNREYLTTVNNNTWTINLPPADAQLLKPDEIISATVTNSAGNQSTPATRPIKHLPGLPGIAINVVAGDDIINAAEDDTAVPITGTTSGAPNGAPVSVTINGVNYSAQVNNNTWAISLPANAAQALKPTEIITAIVTDGAGNISTPAMRPIQHNGVLPALTIGVVAGDDIINAQEDDTDVLIRGTSQNAENGSRVTLNLNNQTYTAVVNNNTWSVLLPAAQAQQLRAQEIITAVVTNAAGNTSPQATRPIKHTLNLPKITINAIAIDDIINLTEDDNSVIISGTSTNVENGQTLSLSLNGKNYATTVTNNTWSVSIPALDAQALDASELVEAQVTNIAGDKAFAERTVKHSKAEPSVDIDVIAGDDIINTQEDNNPVLISGSTTLVENGQTVELEINGKKYTGLVTDNRWSINLPALDAQALDATERATAIATNSAGDKSEPAARDIQHSLADPTISINPVAVDDHINTSEDDLPVVISGKTTLVENNAKVSVVINGKTYSGLVADNTWSIAMPAADAQALAAQENINANVTNNAGDKAQTQRPITHSINAPTISINVIAGDDVINASEDDSPVLISGKTTEVENGASVTLAINGKTYTAPVINNTWSTNIPAIDAQALGASTQVTAQVVNKFGDNAQSTRTVVHSGDSPTITINVVAGDDIINTSEDDSQVLINGKTTLVEDGQVLTLTLNNKNYSALVTNSTWSTAISAAEAQALAAQEKVSASVSNKAGDKASAERIIKHSLNVPTLSINTIAGDDIINTLEDDAPVIVSGTSSLIEDNTAISVAINGKNYPGLVTNNTWSIVVPALDAQNLDAQELVSAAATNLAGDKAQAQRTVNHSINTPTIAINLVAGDDIINASEDDSPVLISGKTTLVEDAQLVVLNINGKNYSAAVTNNTWSTSISAADAQALAASEKITADVANKAGDKASAQRSISHALNTPTLSINVIAGDDIINTLEDDAPVLVTGSTTLVEDGAIVTLVINGKNYTATVNNNSWSLSIPAADAQALDAQEQVVATVSNRAGDSTQALRTVNHSLVAPSLSINVVAGDDIINLSEDDSPVVISGKSTLVEDGQTVSLIINGKNYSAQVTNNSWTTNISAADAQALDAQENITASVSNKAGDKADANHAITHSTNAPAIKINVIAGDDIINTLEDDAPVQVSGSSTLIEDGAIVSIIVNGKTYTGTVNNNSWVIAIPALDAQALDAQELVVASVTNKAGDKAEAQRTISHSTGTPTLSINVIAGDDIINLSEDDSPVLISGNSTLVEDGQSVNLVINGKNYSAQVANNSWATTIPAVDAQALDAQENITANVSNKAGDKADANRAITHSTNAPSIKINVIAGDDIINASEDDAPVIISGSTALIEDGAKVVVSVNGKVYEAIVTANSWSVAMPAADAQALSPSSLINAEVTNKAGDKAQTNRTVQHSGTGPTISINPVAQDDIINTTEDDAPVIISGKTNLIEDNQIVTLLINGKTYSAPVNNNTWTTSIPAADAQSLDAQEVISATATNIAGDKADGQRTINHSTNSPTIVINVIAGDDIINTLEDDAPVLVTGSSTLIEDGGIVSISVNGKTYTGTVNNNTWAIFIPPADLQALDAQELVVASVTNKAGDKAQAQRNVTHSINAPSITINTIAGDDIINASEDDLPVIISGTTTLVEDGGKVIISVNGKTYQAIVSANSWSVVMPAADAQALGASNLINAEVINNAGDKAQINRTVLHFDTGPTISISPVAIDDIINTSEDDAPVVISGSTTLVEDNQSATIVVNGKTYNAQVNNNSWSTTISAADAQKLDSQELISAQVNNLAGDKAEALRSINHSINTPTIAINTIAGDDIINSREDDAEVLITGTTTLVEDGATLKLIINGNTYSTTVINSSWTAIVPALAAQALDERELVQASVTNKAGDTAEAQRAISHYGTAPTLVINPIAGDDVINGLEDDTPVQITGKTTGVEDGAKLTLMVNDKTYSAIVTDSGWMITLPLADVQALDAVETIQAQVTNQAGETASAQKPLGHTVSGPAVSIATIAGDDIINLREELAEVAITGTTSAVEDGQQLRLVVNDRTYTTNVADNRWQILMPSADAQALDSKEEVLAAVQNKAGDLATNSRNLGHTIEAPSISINPIAGDDVINAQEDDAPVIITGTTSGVPDGSIISVTVNGKTYDTTVNGNTWSLPLPVADVQALDPSEQVTAKVTTPAGDSAEQERTLKHSGQTPTLVINPVANDDIINAREDDNAVEISGTTSLVEDGQVLSLTINGTSYPATVSGDKWSVVITAQQAQALPAATTLAAEVTNLAGDSAQGSRPIEHVLVAPTVSINPVAGDDTINATEDDAPVLVSGKTVGVEDGTELVVTINGKHYPTRVEDNLWAITMPAADAQALEQSNELVAKVTTRAGDSAEASKPINHYGSGAVITLAPITGDNLINSLEDNAPVNVWGTTTGVEDGARVTFELNEEQYQALVKDNRWSLELTAAEALALKPEDTAHAEVTNSLGDRAETTAVVHHLAYEDTDGDGLSDDVESDKNTDGKDSDGDKVPDHKDIDSDNDGLLDEDEIRDTSTDTNRNNIPDSFDAAVTKGTDSDSDGIDDRFDAAVPGQPAGVDLNNDGIKDNAPVRDSDGDGLGDYIDLDSDNDAVPDLYEIGGSHFDSNADGRADGKDSDGDGLLDVFDPSQGNQPLTAADVDKDGIADPLDLDADNDGLPDITEDAIGVPDPDGNGIISSGAFVDSDQDGLGDAADINSGGKLGVRVDSDFNGSSDGQSTDRDGDGITDIEESLGKGPAQILDPDGDGQLGNNSGNQKPTDANNNGIPDLGENNLAADAAKDSNGNGISDGVEQQLTNLNIPVPTSNAQGADFDRDGYPDWIEVRFGGNPLDNAEADADGDGVPDWVENTDVLLDNQNDSDADGFVDLLEQVQGTPVAARNSSDELFDAALKNLLNPDRYAGRSLKPVIWVDMQQGSDAVASLGNSGTSGTAVFSAKIGNYHVFGDPRDAKTQPVYDWSASSPEVLALADATDGASLSIEASQLAAGHYQVTAKVTLAGHTSTSVQRFVVAASPSADSDRDHLANNLDRQDANLGLLQALPAQNNQLLQAAAITLVNNTEQLDWALRLRLGAAAQATGAGQARLTPDAFSQYGTAIGNDNYTTRSNENFTYAQVYDLEVTNLPHVGGSAEVVIPLAAPIGADLQLQRFNPLSGWQAFNTSGGDEYASAPAGTDGVCPAPGSSQYEPGLNGGDSCLLVRVTDGGLNDGDNNDGALEDGQGDVNGLIQLGLTLAQETPKQQAPEPAQQGRIKTGLKGKGGAFGWLFVALTPALIIFRRRKHHDQAR